MGVLDWLVSTAGYLPHGLCLAWDPVVLLVHVASDLVIGLSYLSIPIALFVFASRRRDLMFRWVIFLFAGFIIACGVTHLVSIMTLWRPVYAAEGMVKAITAALSLATAVSLWPLMPRALALPSPAMLGTINRRLEREVIERRAAEIAVQRLNTDLEDRVRERTAELATAVSALETEAAGRAATARSLEQANTLLATVIHASPRAAIGLAADDQVILWNAAAERLFGPRPERFVLPDDAATRQALGSALPQGKLSFETSWPAADGTTLPVAVTAVTLPLEDQPKDGMLLIIEDQTEVRQARQQAETAQRTEAIAQLTGGVAHDFNNLLTVVLGNAEAMADRLDDDSHSAVLLSEIRAAADRGADLVRQLLAYAGKQTLAPKATSVGDLIGRIEGLMRRLATSRRSLRIALAPDLAPAWIDAGQLEQALLNLVINARDATGQAGEITLTARNHGVTATEAATSCLQAGAYVRVSVRDNGVGMSEAVLARVFEPFFTTKEVGKGTGLGLSMVQGFAQQSGGKVLIESREGTGTQVTLLLPTAAAAGPATEAGALAGKARPALRQGMVLLVDDDELVRPALARSLRSLGLTVSEAADGEAAETLLRATGAVDLMITDLVMPGRLGGLELVGVARLVRPGLPILLISGYADHGADAPLPTGVMMLSKPFERRHLINAIGTLLESVDPGSTE